MFRPVLLWPKQVVDKLYTPDNIVVLRLLYPYRIITLGSNKHNEDDAPWNQIHLYSLFCPESMGAKLDIRLSPQKLSGCKPGSWTLHLLTVRYCGINS